MLRKLSVLSLLVAVAAGCGLIEGTAGGVARGREIPEECGIVRITTNVTGAQIFVDDALYGTIQRAGRPQDIVVEAGTHNLALKKFGYQDFQATIGLKQGAINTIDVTMKRTPPETVELPEREESGGAQE